ncbi:DUF2891 domain-containing protein [Marinicella meishanensis]|uniref:DUF2891 domain-containing protein n=1 Tax=Marinicella meishanensis TaxID=2873263 RepID=UPI001CBFCB01|nr:DUF2891 domain-containing protein [Marinicella sp. NBU2979]
MGKRLLTTALSCLLTTAAMADDSKDLLILALHQDQQHRSEIQRLQRHSPDDRLVQSLQQAQDDLDLNNQALLDGIIQQLGRWPGIQDVGEHTAPIAMLLFKRMTAAQQSQYLPLIRQAVTQQNIPAQWYADAHDHHQMQSNQPQHFGHLLTQSATDGSHRLYPITSWTAVQAERQALDLPPLQQAMGERDWLLRQNFVQPDQPELIAAEPLMGMAQLALKCIDQTYPNQIKHVLNAPVDAQTPEQMYPVFFGCFDWHSAVHGHWLLARAAKTFPNHPQAAVFIERLDAHFQADKLQQELHYLQQPGRQGFERPYGLAWLLQLYSELHDWDHPLATQWTARMAPIRQHVIQSLSSWIPKLAYPIRSGEHSQTAFAFGLALDHARQTQDAAFTALLISHSKRLYQADRDCPIHYEPSGHDFLSPCLAAADLMRRLLPPAEFGRWLNHYLPASKQRTPWLSVAEVTDRVDGKLAHLDGLNLARAWMLEGIAAGLPADDRRRQVLGLMAQQHAQSGLAAVTGEHYSGGHWLGSFAVYHLTQRGID